MTNGQLKAIEHFDGKAEVADYIEGMKGNMVATYFMPGLYMQNVKGMIRPGHDGVPTFTQPWSPSETHVPLFDSAVDSGTFLAGILAQEPQSTNGVSVHAVSQWCTPNEIVDTVSKVSGTLVKFRQVPEDVFRGPLPPSVAEELTENMVLVRDYSYFGKGQKKEQARSDKCLVR